MSDHFAGGNFQGGEHRLGSVPDILIGPALRFPGTEREQRLRAIERLNPWLFVYAQHQRILRRVQIQPHDVQ
jgi:hypothetical protein